MDQCHPDSADNNQEDQLAIVFLSSLLMLHMALFYSHWGTFNRADCIYLRENANAKYKKPNLHNKQLNNKNVAKLRASNSEVGSRIAGIDQLLSLCRYQTLKTKQTNWVTLKYTFGFSVLVGTFPSKIS